MSLNPYSDKSSFNRRLYGVKNSVSIALVSSDMLVELAEESFDAARDKKELDGAS